MIAKPQMYMVREYPIAPSSVKDVGAAIVSMDNKYGTKFSSWIKDEENLSYIATYKKYIFEEYMQKNGVESIVNAMLWMTSGWSIPSVSELILKLFYHYRLDSDNFGRIVYGICAGWEEDDVVELCASLLIGESSQVASKFMYNFVLSSKAKGSPLSADDVSVLCLQIASSLRWSESYQRFFLLEFTELYVADEDRKAAQCADIRQQLSGIEPVAPMGYAMDSASALIESHHQSTIISRAKTPTNTPEIGAVSPESGDFDRMVLDALTSLELAQQCYQNHSSFSEYTALVMSLLGQVMEEEEELSL